MSNRTFYQGPAYFTHDSVTYQVLDQNWQAKDRIVTADLKTNLGGTVGRREEYVISTIDVMPIAFRTGLATLVGKLLPFTKASGHLGTLLFPATDKPFVIQTADGRGITYSAGAISKPPAMQFAPGKPLFGTATFTCLRKADTAATDTAAHVVDTTSAFSMPAFDPEDIVDALWTLAIGDTPSTPYDNVECDIEGVRLEPDYSWSEIQQWRNGLLNYQLTDVKYQVRFTPRNLNSSHLDALVQRDGVGGRGTLLGASRGVPLTVTGVAVGDPNLSIPLAVLTEGAANFGSDSRVGEIVGICEPDWSDSGAIVALSYVTE